MKVRIVAEPDTILQNGRAAKPAPVVEYRLPGWAALEPRPRRRARGFSFLASAGLHGIVIALLAQVPAHSRSSARPVYDELIRPHANKIVWYNFQKQLPDVVADKRIGTFPKPRGEHKSKQAIIAASPNAKSNQQFIWRPVPKLEILQDLSLPNLIVRANTSLPALWNASIASSSSRMHVFARATYVAGSRRRSSAASASDSPRGT